MPAFILQMSCFIIQVANIIHIIADAISLLSIQTMPFPSLKMGPGQSSRSHTADEFVLLSEIEEGIGIYEKFIKQLAETL